MEKLNFLKSDKSLYAGKPGVITFIEVPELTYLTVDGMGDPNHSSEFSTAVSALYGIAYGVKFRAKSDLCRDHVVGRLEGLWWADDMNAYINAEPAQWRWKLMIRQPEWISDAMVAATRQDRLIKLAREKNPETTPDMVERVRLERITEGPCLQVLHIGPYADEAPLIARLHHEEMPARGLTFGGLHHEIYLSDRRKTAPAALKTILRQPVRPFERVTAQLAKSEPDCVNRALISAR